MKIDRKMNDMYREYQLEEINLDKYKNRIKRSMFNYSHMLYFLIMSLIILICGILKYKGI